MKGVGLFFQCVTLQCSAALVMQPIHNKTPAKGTAHVTTEYISGMIQKKTGKPVINT
jgi:hypothetical protein